MEKGSLIIADSQVLIRAGVKSLVGDLPQFHRVTEAVDRLQLFELLKNHYPQLIILDYNSLSDLTIYDLAAITRSHPQSNILVISSDNDKQTIVKVLGLGVKGYLTKECSQQEVLRAIHATAAGEKFYCNKILDILMEERLDKNDKNTAPVNLTLRETEVLRLIAEGNTTNAIAASLFLSYHTINSHRKNIIKKLKIKSPTEFVIYALEMGIIKAEK